MKRALPRVALAALFSAILVVSSVVPVAANGPVYRGPWDPTGDTSYQACGLPIGVTFDQIDTRVTVWVEKDGTEVDHIQGDAKVTWTNLLSGKSVTLNLSGPGHITVSPDGSVYQQWSGQNLPVVGGTVLNTQGRIVITIDPNGDMTMSINGHQEDVCAALRG